MENIENKFIELSKINVNEYTEKIKNGAKENKYLSWAYAWSEFCKVYKNSSYKIKKYCKDFNIPYFFKQIDKKIEIPTDLQIREFPNF